VEALKRVAARVVSRADWFQGRELVEALAVMVAIRRGDTAEGVGQFVRALALASGNDPYGGAWLTAACAEALLPHAPEEVEKAIATYGPRVATLGFAELTARFRELTGGSVGHPAPERRGN
jgi:hypothetical protein